MQALIELLAFLTPYGTHSYIVMFGILIACGFGFPMPEDVVLITGGILASHSVTNFWVVVLVCMAGVLMGDGIVFGLGRYFGPSIKKKGIFKKIFTEKVDQRAEAIIRKYGDKVVFMARFMPGLRTPIFLTCGIYQVKPWKFLLLDGTAAIVSVPLWIYVGYVFGQNLEELEAKIRHIQVGLYSGLAILIVAFIAYSMFKRRMAKIVSPTQNS
jgi:membrane protein DedA with SNARE-associated domain